LIKLMTYPESNIFLKSGSLNAKPNGAPLVRSLKASLT
jgi:hypothetical protein